MSVVEQFSDVVAPYLDDPEVLLYSGTSERFQEVLEAARGSGVSGIYTEFPTDEVKDPTALDAESRDLFGHFLDTQKLMGQPWSDLSLPSNLQPLVKELWGDIKLPTEESAFDIELAPATVFEGDGRYRRVKIVGADFFQRIAVDPDITTVDLPLFKPHTHQSVLALKALGFSFAGLFPMLHGGLVRVKKLSGAPSSFAREIPKWDYEETKKISQQYQAELQAVLAAKDAADNGQADVAQVRETWYQRARETDPAQMFLWSERFWRYRMIGSACPIFMTSKDYGEWGAAAERVVQKLHQAVLDIAEDPEKRLHILGSDKEIATNFPFFGRFDGSVQPSGPSFFEFNVGAIGFSDTDRSGAVYRALELDKDLPTQICPIFKNMLAALEKLHRGFREDKWPPVLAIPVAAEQEVTWAPGLLAYVKLFQTAGWNTFFCPLGELKYEGGALLSSQGQKIDLIARAYFPGAPGSEAVEKALADKACLLANPPAPHGSKGLFELLDDPAIPWTRILRDGECAGPQGDSVQLLEFAKQNRESLVLKPCDGYGGHGVLLGKKTDPAEWEATVDKVAKDYEDGYRSVLQVCTDMPRQNFLDRSCTEQDMFWDLNAFVFDGKFGGLAARLSSSALTNISLGGGAVPIYVV